MEKSSAALERGEEKKKSMRKSMLHLTLEWKDLEKHVESIQNSLEECWTEMDSREKNLELVRKSIDESNDKVEAIRSSLEAKEKELRSIEEEQRRDMKLKEENLGSIERSIEERMREVECREEKLGEQRKFVEELFEKLEFEHKQFERIQRKMDQKFKEIKGKEKHIESRTKEVHLIQDWIERRAKELDTKEERIEERCEELEVKEKELDSARKANEELAGALECRERELDSVRKTNEEIGGELDSREKQFDSVKKYVTDSYKDFRAKKRQLVSEEKLLEEYSKGLDLRERQLEDWSHELQLKDEKIAKGLDLREKQLENWSNELQLKEEKLAHTLRAHVVTEQPEDESYADIRLCMTMDGRKLQAYLNEHSNVTACEVRNALKLSLDPAKIILDAMEGFYPPHLKSGDIEFEGDLVRRNCIVLLEQLREISSRIEPHVQEAALKLAREWRMKLVAVAKNSSEVLGFLQLLASYELTSEFCGDDIWTLCESVAEHKAAPKLCGILGFKEKIPDLIQNLSGREQSLAAIKYIYAYGLVEKFPPVPLLKGHLNYLQEISNNICKEGNNSLEAQKRAARYEVSTLRAVIECITDHRLESEFLSENLEARVEQLERKIADRRESVPHLTSDVQSQEQAGEKITPRMPTCSCESQLKIKAGINCTAPVASSEDKLQKEDEKMDISPAYESGYQMQKEARCFAANPPSEALPQKEDKCNSQATASSSEAQLQKQAGKKITTGTSASSCESHLQYEAWINCSAPGPAPIASSEDKLRKEDGKNDIAPASADVYLMQKEAQCFAANPPSSEALAQNEDENICNSQAPASSSEAQSQKQAGKKCIATACEPPRKEDGIKCNSRAPASLSEAQKQKQAGKKCVASGSEAQATKRAGKKRFPPIPAPSLNTRQHHQQEHKRTRTSKAPVVTAYPVHSTQPPPPTSAPVVTAYPVHSPQPPPPTLAPVVTAFPVHSAHRRPTTFSSEQGMPYSRPPAEYGGPRGSSAVTSHMNHLDWEYGLDALPNRGARPFDSAGYHFDSAENFYHPSLEGRARHHSYHHPWRYSQPL